MMAGLASLCIAACCSPSVHQLPSLRLSVEDSIRSFDFTVDENHVVHIVWVAYIHDPTLRSGSSKEQVWYLHGRIDTATWSEPKLLASAPMSISDQPAPRILSVRG